MILTQLPILSAVPQNPTILEPSSGAPTSDRVLAVGSQRQLASTAGNHWTETLLPLTRSLDANAAVTLIRAGDPD